jgi:hypothetical protein
VNSLLFHAKLAKTAKVALDSLQDLKCSLTRNLYWRPH